MGRGRARGSAGGRGAAARLSPGGAGARDADLLPGTSHAGRLYAGFRAILNLQDRKDLVFVSCKRTGHQLAIFTQKC